MDVFYTPTLIAQKMVGYSTITKVEIVADFTVGGGELLKAAEQAWPSARFVGSEINSETTDLLTTSYPHWRIEKLDFTRLADNDGFGPFSDLAGKISLILMNPPFSCRGAVRHESRFLGETFHSSYGLAFVITALRFLSPKGQLVAILPAGTLSNQKDRDSWDQLRRLFHIDSMHKNGHRTFTNCSPDTVIVRFTRKDRPRRSSSTRLLKIQSTLPTDCAIDVVLFRGRVPVHAALNGTSKTFPFIHNTNLSGNRADLSNSQVRDSYESLQGPVVLISRIGLPKEDKIVVFLSPRKIVLSDCVIAIRCESNADAKAVHMLIVDNWDSFRFLYNGTCAKFITLESLASFLHLIGIRVTKT